MFSQTKLGELALCFPDQPLGFSSLKTARGWCSLSVRIVQGSTLISSIVQLIKNWHPWPNQTTLRCKLSEGSARPQWIITVWEWNSERKTSWFLSCLKAHDWYKDTVFLKKYWLFQMMVHDAMQQVGDVVEFASSQAVFSPTFTEGKMLKETH